ncbi:hypothetical protein B2J93_6198 [Marssonina coronariae]|uniref:Uncharacterized protein n=1 Tax=Diplocarpon coronariae TaxID=2795749 RepID=A0A218ZH87_9HELO|nr:hypothetical protein B2J93_6198 [Marssonina coronariae]
MSASSIDYTMSSELGTRNLPPAALSVKNVSLSPGSSPIIPSKPVAAIMSRPQMVNSRSTGSVSFTIPEWKDQHHRDGNSQRIIATKSKDAVNETTPTRIYWRSPASMIACLFLGILVALGHHLYYASLRDDLVGDQDEQQRNLRCLQLPSLITPATLGVIPGAVVDYVPTNVSSLLISTNNTNQYTRFEYSAPLLPDTVEGVNDTNNFFVGPRTIISRLSSAAAATGSILPITPPYTNSSYSLQFYGPTVKCRSEIHTVPIIHVSFTVMCGYWFDIGNIGEEANSTQATIMDRLLRLKMTEARDNFTEVTSAYFGFVPTEYIMNGGKVTDFSTVDAISQVMMQRPTHASNQFWAAYRRYAWNISGNYTEVHYMVCRLYNASYDIKFEFMAGNQTITKNRESTQLNEIEYPKDDPITPTNYAAHSYSAFMWVLTNQLVGSMGFWTDNSTNRKFSSISTPIEHNSLLGSVDLDPFFDYNDALYVRNATNINKKMSDQRNQDKKLAMNKTLSALIEELSFNVTISFMSSNLLSPNVTTLVQRSTNVNVYSYKSTSLLLAYGLAVSTTLIANILGVIAYIQNKSAHDRSFSSILGATRETGLNDLFI